MVVIKAADERLLPRLELVLDRLILEEKIRYIYVDVVALTWLLRRCQAYEAMKYPLRRCLPISFL